MSKQIPNSWELIPLGKIASIISGGTPNRDKSKYWGKDIPWVTPTDITNTPGRFLFKTQESLSALGLKRSSASILPAGTILMTSRATVGESRIAAIQVCTNQGFKSIVLNGKADPLFIFYQMQRCREAYRIFGIGSTFIEVNKKDTERFEILVPQNLSEQKTISAVLDSVDQTIEKTEDLIQKYQQIKQGLMHDLFIRGVTPDGKLRPTREQTPELYEETPIGWIPKEWELKPLITVATYQHGRPFPSTEYSNEGVILLRPGNLHNSGLISFDEAHTTRIPQNWIAKCPSYIVKFDDILMNLTAQSLEDQFLGRVCLNKQQEPSLLNQRIARFKATNIDHYFLYWILKSEIFRSQIDRTTKGTKVQHLYNEDLNRVILGIPKEAEEQKQISKRLFACLDQIELHSESLKKYIMLKSGLMHDLLTGTVKVKVDE